MTIDNKQRISKHSIPEPNSGCWLWNGAVLMAGYGVASDGKKCVTAHRLSYKSFVGEIPKGMIIAHKCDTPSCVNPDHLWLATHKQNSSDMVKKGRSASKERCGKSKLKSEQVDFIRKSELSHRSLGKMFNVSHVTIGAIKRETTWI